MSENIKLEDVVPLTLDKNQLFDALCMRYKDHVELLRVMTGVDFRLFGGVMTIQLALGGWLASSSINSWKVLVGLLILDGALALIGALLLRNNAIRRKEAIATLKNVMAALGFYKEGFYVKGITINAPGRLKLWGQWFIGGVIIAYIGLIIVGIATLMEHNVVANSASALNNLPT